MKISTVILILIIFSPLSLWSQQPGKQTIEERLIRLEMGQQNLENRLTDVNTRLSELRTDMNQRFDDFKFWLQIIFGAVVACLGAILIQWMIMWKRIVKVESQVEDRIVLGYREEDLRDIKRRVEKLEASLTR